MGDLDQTNVRNRLLKWLSAADFALLQPHLREVTVATGRVLIASNTVIDNAYFPEQGLTSIIAAYAAGARIEVGMVGREGLVGAAPLLLGVDRSPHEYFVQMPGEVLLIPAEALQAASAHSATLRAVLMRYVHTLVVQTAQIAFANAAFRIEIRLARWLLMYHDRGDGDDLFVTHEFLSIMLGVRRPGVSVALQTLEGNRLIKSTRGTIRLLDRPGLEALANGSYGAAEAEYGRLFGQS